jgi:magnesium chelatase family protein
LRKEGGAFDLAIALGMLAASGQLDPAQLASVIAAGELALDGSLRPIRGVLPMALAARRDGRRLLIPSQNAREVHGVEGATAVPVASLREALEVLSGAATPAAQMSSAQAWPASTHPDDLDFSDVKGQAHAKRALEVAVAGSHHALLIGPPGSGKSMLAQRVSSIQAELTLEEALEATTIHSVAGSLNGAPLIRQRPFRAPHHTSSAVALVGGGTHPKPGEISLAHHGILFLDELPEFPRDALEALRQPLEDGRVHIARAKRSLTFPARFMLIAAMNPCPSVAQLSVSLS